MYPVPLLTVYSATKVHDIGRFLSEAPVVLTATRPSLDRRSNPPSSCVQAFMDFFSRGLQEEYRRQGIIIQVSWRLVGIGAGSAFSVLSLCSWCRSRHLILEQLITFRPFWAQPEAERELVALSE